VIPVALLALLPFMASAQALADLRTTNIPSGALKGAPNPPSISASPITRPRCFASSLTPSLQSTSTTVVDKISARLAATPLFVRSVPQSPTACPEDQNILQTVAPGILIPGNFCPAVPGPLRMTPQVSPVCRPGGIVVFRSWDILSSSSVEPVNSLRVKHPSESFHWGPAITESVNFLIFEHAFRLVDDPYLRYLMFHKPFWHDWLVSAGQFDMSRWGDGDDFLVNYIGHPMQGGVTGDIYLQNDPRSRGLKIGRSSEYWKSRWRAMVWSAIYSMYFEIGPGLSETAIGNEGGYTYTPGCGHYVCDRPGYKPPTNNTGWVDFIVTPTVGTGLIVLEDAIETKIVNRIVKDDPRFGYKILRSALNPSASMANMMAGRYPWFRPSDDDFNRDAEFTSAYNPATQMRTEPWKYEGRWDAGVHYANIDLPMDWPGCSACRAPTSGVGTNLGYRLSSLWYFDSEFNAFPASGSSNGRGRAEELLTGVKIGRTLGSWGLFATFRPGFIHYQKTLVPGSQTEYESMNRFAFDAGGVVEYYASSRSTIRFDAGTTFVRYLTGHPDPRQLPVTVLSTDYIVTQGNFHLGSGYVFRF
jgi:hypothetical protein